MFSLCNEKLENTKGVIGRRKSKKDEQYSCQKEWEDEKRK
jgi:hypothetical protein